MGITKVNLATSTVEYLQYERENSNSLSNSQVRSIAQDQNGIIWIGTDRGLSRYLPDGTFDRIYHDEADPFSLAGNVIYKVLVDSRNNVWVGSRKAGINLYIEGKYGFELFQSSPLNSSSLAMNSVGAFAETPDHQLLVGLDGGGIDRYDDATKAFSHQRSNPNDASSITNDKALALTYDLEGGLWIGYWAGGVSYTDPKTGTIRRYRHVAEDPRSLGGDNVQYMLTDSRGTIWVGLWRDGASRYNPDTDDFTNFKNNPDNPEVNWTTVNHIREASDGKIWFSCQTSGVIVIDPLTDEITTYQASEVEGTLTSKSIGATLEDSEGRTWVATIGGGLNLLDDATGRFTAYRKRHGLPSDGIVAIEEDDDGKLWLATNNGLSQFDPEEETFRNFNVSDGLQDYQFLPRKSFKRSNGQIVFGGNNGFNMFDPRNIHSNPVKPIVHLTDFKLANESVKVQEGGILTQSIGMTTHLTLKHHQSFFSIEFVGLNYYNGHRNTYSYMMEGLHDEWVDVGQDRKATFFNLDPGKYIFTVRAANSDGLMSTQPAHLEINIMPPFWATWWFRGGSAFLLASLLWLIYRERRKATLRNEENLRERIRAGTAQVTSQNDQLQQQSQSLKLAITETNFVLKEALESGNFSARIDLDGKSGEWLSLAKSINELFDSVASPFGHIKDVVGHVAEGTLVHRLQGEAKGDVGQVADALNTALDNLEVLIRGIMQRVDTVDETF